MRLVPVIDADLEFGVIFDEVIPYDADIHTVEAAIGFDEIADEVRFDLLRGVMEEVPGDR